MLGTIEPYFTFKGNAKEALTFYSEVFELAPPNFMLFSDMPQDDQDQMKDMVEMDQIMHGSVDFNGTFLMASDISDKMADEEKFIEGNNFQLSWSSENIEDVKKVWDRFIKAGAEVIMPLEKTFWAPLYGILKDTYGVQWMIQIWNREETAALE